MGRSGIGRVKLRALTAEHIERLYAAVLASGCAPGSVAHVRRTLSAALNTAARRGHIPRNPVPAAEIASLLSIARSRRNGVRWSLVFLGLRQGEALALHWDDLDFDNYELTGGAVVASAAVAASGHVQICNSCTVATVDVSE